VKERQTEKRCTSRPHTCSLLLSGEVLNSMYMCSLSARRVYTYVLKEPGTCVYLIATLYPRRNHFT